MLAIIQSKIRLISKNLKIKIYKTVILPVVLYGCKNWSLILRYEHRLRVLETGCSGFLEITGGRRVVEKIAL